MVSRMIPDALDMLAAHNDVLRLAEWIRTKHNLATWSLSRLRHLDSRLYAEALAWMVVDAREAKPEIPFATLLKADTERACELVVTAERDGWPTASRLKESYEKARKPIWEEDDVNRIAASVLNRLSSDVDRSSAVGALVPDENPRRFPDEIVNRTLSFLFAEEKGNGWKNNFTVTAACRAAAMRGDESNFISVREVFESSNDLCHKGEHFESLASLALRIGGEARSQAVNIVEKELANPTKLSLNDMIRAAWILDARELCDMIEKHATFSPFEKEVEEKLNRRCSSPRSLGELRSHLSRQITALWREPSSLTYGKMLMVFLDGRAPYDQQCRRASLAKLKDKLNDDEKNKLLSFLEWYESEKMNGRKDKPRSANNLARSVFGWPPLVFIDKLNQ